MWSPLNTKIKKIGNCFYQYLAKMATMRPEKPIKISSKITAFQVGWSLRLASAENSAKSSLFVLSGGWREISPFFVWVRSGAYAYAAIFLFPRI